MTQVQTPAQPISPALPTPKDPSEIVTGLTWHDERGERKILRIHEGRCVVSISGMNLSSVYRLEEMPRVILVDEHNALNARQRREQLEQEKAQQAQAQAEYAASPLGRFLATMPRMQAGRAKKSLELKMRYRGEVMSRAAIVDLLLSEGATLSGERLMLSERGTFMDAQTLTVTAMRYAAWCAENVRPEPTQT